MAGDRHRRHARHPAKSSRSPCRSRAPSRTSARRGRRDAPHRDRGAPRRCSASSAAPSCAARDCGVAARRFSARRGPLRCPLCARAEPLPERCPGCGGHRLSPLGWDAERVEASVRRRFPQLTVSRTDRAPRCVIGTPGAPARASRRRASGAVGIVALDGVLGACRISAAASGPSSSSWAAAEATGAGRPRHRADAASPSTTPSQAVQAQTATGILQARDRAPGRAGLSAVPAALRGLRAREGRRRGARAHRRVRAMRSRASPGSPSTRRRPGRSGRPRSCAGNS